MSENQQFSVNWTITDVLIGRRFFWTLKKSEQFIQRVNGQWLSLALSAGLLPDNYLMYIYGWFENERDGQTLLLQDLEYRKIAICVKTSSPIDVVPNLELMDDNGSWVNMPINWYGHDGNTHDKMFFGSTNLLDEGRLRAQFLQNNSLMIKCTIVPAPVND